MYLELFLTQSNFDVLSYLKTSLNVSSIFFITQNMVNYSEVNFITGFQQVIILGTV